LFKPQTSINAKLNDESLPPAKNSSSPETTKFPIFAGKLK